MAKQWIDVCKGLAVGSVVGAVAGILLAPKSGKETREEIRKKAGELSAKTRTGCEKTLNRTKNAYDALARRLKHRKESPEEYSEQLE